MIAIETYIKDLLYQYDCLVVPNFGAFLTHSHVAKIDQDTHTIFPPQKTIAFNQQLANNDGLLANYIAEVEKWSYNIALEKINKSVTQIKSLLQTGETIHFKSIGSFFLNVEGRIVFQPKMKTNFLSEAYGLEAFEINALQNNLTIQETTPSDSKITSEITPKRWRFRQRYAASIIFTGLACFLIYNYLENSITTYNQNAQVEAQQLISAKVQEATFVISNPLPAVKLALTKKTNLVQASKRRYHIVAGAFSKLTNARRFVKQLKSEGFDNPNNIGVNKNGLHVVAYGSFNRLDLAKKDLKHIKRDINPDAWILSKL